MSEPIRWIKTHCARMDHGGCALNLGVKDNKIEAVKGDPDGYLNKGYICPKGMASPDRLTHPLRLKHPMKRRGHRGEGKWQEISWNEAIALVKPLTIAGMDAWIVELEGPAGATPGGFAAAMVVSAVSHGGKTWFFKMSGAAPAIAGARESYDAFVGSVNF